MRLDTARYNITGAVKNKLSLPGSMLMVGHGKAQHKRITFWIMTDRSNIFDVGHGTAYHQRSSYVNYHRPVQYTGGWSRQGATSAAQEQQAGQEQQCKYMHFTENHFLSTQNKVKLYKSSVAGCYMSGRHVFIVNIYMYMSMSLSPSASSSPSTECSSCA